MEVPHLTRLSSSTRRGFLWRQRWCTVVVVVVVVFVVIVVVVAVVFFVVIVFFLQGGGGKGGGHTMFSKQTIIHPYDFSRPILMKFEFLLKIHNA